MTLCRTCSQVEFGRWERTIHGVGGRAGSVETYTDRCTKQLPVYPHALKCHWHERAPGADDYLGEDR